MAKEKLQRRIKRFFIAHRGNRYRPTMFTKEIALVAVLVLLILEGSYLVQVDVVLHQSGFLATVLPAALTTLANEDRAALDLPALIDDPLLDKAAQAAAEDMASKGYFAHVSPEGKDPWYWLNLVDYPYGYAGQNLAVDFSDSSEVENAWMNSPAHRANILKEEYTRIGIGIAQGIYQGKQTTFVVQYFATRSDEAQVSKAQGTATHEAPQQQAVATVPAGEPVRNVATNVAPTVLGTEAAKPVMSLPSPGLVAVATTSPNRVIEYILVALTVFVAILLALALYTHARKRVFILEVVSSGLAVIGVGTVLYLYNGAQSSVLVPGDGQSASVVRALSQ